MAIEKFTKQHYEEFTIAADFSNNMGDTEVIIVQIVSAVDFEGTDATDLVLNTGTIQNNGAQKVTVLVRDGLESNSPYKITFYCETNTFPVHKWELDVRMVIKEL